MNLKQSQAAIQLGLCAACGTQLPERQCLYDLIRWPTPKREGGALVSGNVKAVHARCPAGPSIATE